MNKVNFSKLNKFFLGANTPFGFSSFFNQIGEYKRDWYRFFIKGGPGTGKSSLMKTLVTYFNNNTDNIELIYCSSDPESLDGAIFYDQKFSVVDATPPHTLEPLFPGTFEQTISLCDCWDDSILKKNQDIIINLCDQNKFYHSQATNLFLGAYGLLKNSFDIVNRFIDKDHLDIFVNEFIDKQLSNLKTIGHGEENLRFLSTVSVGKVVFFDQTIKNIADKIFVINDPFGPISNYILSKIRESLLSSNIDIITCYCSIFNKNKIDHILVPSLKMAFVTSNEYHNFTDPCQKIIDHNDFLKYINRDLEQQLIFNQEETKKIIIKIMDFIQEAKKIHDKIERCYFEAINFKLVDNKIKSTIKFINSNFDNI